MADETVDGGGREKGVGKEPEKKGDGPADLPPAVVSLAKLLMDAIGKAATPTQTKSDTPPAPTDTDPPAGPSTSKFGKLSLLAL